MKEGYDITGKVISEKLIQNAIREALSYSCVVFRANVGTFKQGDRYINTGLPKGFPDLFGFRKSDGKILAIEVKNVKGELSKGQEEFGKYMEECNVLYGVARNVADAFKIVGVKE